MKKLLAVLLMLMMVFSFAACGKDVIGEQSDSSGDGSEIMDGETGNPTGDYADSGNDDYEKIYEYNGAVLSYKPVLAGSDSRSITIEFRVDANQSEENLAVQLYDCTVNGFGISTPGKMMTPANSQMESSINIGGGLADYGIKTFADVKTGFRIYTFNPETYDVNEPAVATVEPVAFETENSVAETELSGLDNVIYDADGVKVYAIQTEEQFYSVLNLYVVNSNDKDVKVVPADLEMNGEKNPVDYSDYAIPVHANSSTFASIPLPNYSIDENTYAATKVEVTSYSLDFEIQ